MGRKIFFNGEFVEEKDAKLSIYDSALMFGDMVFEMTRSFNGVQFKLEEHIDRLLTGLKIFRIDLPYSKSEIIDFCHQTVEKNKEFFNSDDEHRLMIDVSRGKLSIYDDVDVHDGANLIIADFPLKWTVRGMGELFSKGINAVIPSQRAIPASLMDPKIKNRSRLFYLMANIETSLFAGENNWALLLDPDGFIAEGSGDNFFIVKDGVVISPEGRNMLRGISREYVMNELCPELNITAIEKNIEPYDVYTADEAFMTGTPFCMLPVTSLVGINISEGKVGPIFSKLLSQWSTNTAVDIQKQIVSWNKLDIKANTKGASPYSFKK